MPRTLNRPQKAFATAIIITIVLALTPIGWLWWLNDVAHVVTLPMTPVRHAGTAARNWLRPAADPRLRPFDSERERQLLEVLEEFERLYQAADLRASELQEQLEQIQQMPLDDVRVPIRPLIATVTGINPRSPSAKVEINRGTRHGLVAGTIAAYGGVHLIGRVVDPGPLRSMLLPITNAGSDLLEARIMPKDRPDMAMSAAPRVQLEPRGDGTFTAEIEHDIPVAEGDLLRLDDVRWPAAAQAMVIGSIESVRPNDTNSLLKNIRVRPRYQASQLYNITLKIEIDSFDDAASRGGAAR